MSGQTNSIYSSLPPLKCAYNLVPIKEEQPYIAMEDLSADNNHKVKQKYGDYQYEKLFATRNNYDRQNRLCNIFCCFN